MMPRKRTLTSYAREYLAHRRSAGFELESAGKLLLQFAKYADRRSNRSAFTSELAVRWAGLPEQASGVYRSHRLNIVRGFAKYVAIFNPHVEIPPANVFGQAYCRVAPYIYTPAEVRTILAASRKLMPADGLRPHTYSTVFGLLICTGMRLREALRLKRSDIDLRNATISIRETKFKKSRMIPVHSSTVKALRNYAKSRDQLYPVQKADEFFISVRGTGLSICTVEATFIRIRSEIKWSSNSGRQLPRIHDMRHTFACRRLIMWYEQGADIEQQMSALSTYMGHVNVKNTYWYLSAVPELMLWAGTQFERFAAGPTREKP